MNMKRSILQLVFSVVLFGSVTTATNAQYAINRHVFGIGGTETKNAQNHIVGTLGQTLIGVVKNQNTTNHVGFWYGVQHVPVGITREAQLPEVMQLGQNFPNPANGSTTIPFALTQRGFVRLSIANILGEEMQILVADEMQAGAYHAAFDATQFPGGLYFYRLQNEQRTSTRTFVIRK
jgi:hypothetical protein